MKNKPQKPGEGTLHSGQYGKIGPRGGKLPGEITSTKGNPLPPAAKPGVKYVLIDKTKHQK
jgi:hypothetical protein